MFVEQAAEWKMCYFHPSIGTSLFPLPESSYLGCFCAVLSVKVEDECKVS